MILRYNNDETVVEAPTASDIVLAVQNVHSDDYIVLEAATPSCFMQAAKIGESFHVEYRLGENSPLVRQSTNATPHQTTSFMQKFLTSGGTAAIPIIQAPSQPVYKTTGPIIASGRGFSNYFMRRIVKAQLQDNDVILRGRGSLPTTVRDHLSWGLPGRIFNLIFTIIYVAAMSILACIITGAAFMDNPIKMKLFLCLLSPVTIIAFLYTQANFRWVIANMKPARRTNKN